MENQFRESKEIICTACPMGCHTVVERENNTLLVRGARCPRGERYVKEEADDPRRIVATTIKIQNGNIRRLPVKTSRPFPRDQIRALVQAISPLEVSAPVKRGEIIKSNLFGENIDLVATRDVPLKDKKKITHY